jgi:hypothetical protein
MLVQGHRRSIDPVLISTLPFGERLTYSFVICAAESSEWVEVRKTGPQGFQRLSILE